MRLESLGGSGGTLAAQHGAVPGSKAQKGAAGPWQTGPASAGSELSFRPRLAKPRLSPFLISPWPLIVGFLKAFILKSQLPCQGRRSANLCAATERTFPDPPTLHFLAGLCQTAVVSQTESRLEILLKDADCFP